MKESCKNCKYFKSGRDFDGIHLDCSSIVSFPEVGCSNFEATDKIRYGVFINNLETGFFKILNIHDDLRLAESECKQLCEDICKRSSSSIHIFVDAISFDSSLKFGDDILIDICKTVSADLAIAERGFKSGSFKLSTFLRSKIWFDYAKAACRRGASILDILNV